MFMGSRRAVLISPPSFDPATVAWVNQVVTNGGTVSAGRKVTVNTLIKSLKLGGVWTKLDRLWIFAAENTQSALTDMASLHLATANGGITFTSNSGYSGTVNSTTIYIDSGFNPTSGSPLFTQNSAHISVWNTTANSAVGQPAIGSFGGTTPNTSIYCDFDGTSSFFRVNDTNAGPSGGVSAGTPAGWFLATRSGASAQKGFVNTTDEGVTAVSSQAPGNLNMYICGVNNNGTAAGDSHNIAAASIGADVGSVESAFYNAMRAYMTAVGVP